MSSPVVIKLSQDVTELKNTALSDDVKDDWFVGPLEELTIIHKIRAVHPLNRPEGPGLEAIDAQSKGLFL